MRCRCEMTHERLAYSIREAAALLGGISARSVQRLVARGALPTIAGLRRVLIPASALRAFVASGVVEHNPQCAEPVAWKGTKPCYSNAQSPRTGTSNTGTRAAEQLNVLLGRLTGGRPRSLKGSGG